MITVPKFASTVILYRPQNSSHSAGFEIFLIQRSKEMQFLGGFHAFPGGKMEDTDLFDRNLARCKGLSSVEAHQLIIDKQTYHQDPNLSLGFWITGIRELFEEIGVFLVYNNEMQLLDLSDPNVQQRFNTYRSQLIKNEMLILEIMEMEDLYYALDKLFYFRHFITPNLSPIRYDTRFFIARIPPNQVVRPTSSEINTSEWLDPSTIIKRYREKLIKLIPPQYSCIASLRKVDDITAFCQFLP